MPSFLVMLLLYIYIALATYNVEYMTLPLTSIETIIDDVANMAIINEAGGVGKMNGRHRKKERGKGAIREWKDAWSQDTDAVMDIPLGGVCEVLYGSAREVDDSDEESPPL